jgi:hypothetical protein
MCKHEKVSRWRSCPGGQKGTCKNRGLEGGDPFLVGMLRLKCLPVLLWEESVPLLRHQSPSIMHHSHQPWPAGPFPTCSPSQTSVDPATPTSAPGHHDSGTFCIFMSHYLYGDPLTPCAKIRMESRLQYEDYVGGQPFFLSCLLIF